MMPTLSASTSSFGTPVLASGGGGAAPRAPETEFLPPEPTTLAATGLSAGEAEGLLLKQMLTSGATSGRKMADQIRIPFGIVADQLRSLKDQLLIKHTRQAAMGDFEYDLTDEGKKRAHWHAERCTYCGAAPVPLADYIAGVERQSIRTMRLRPAELCTAFADLLLSSVTISQLGQALHAGKGLFLYGQPGNGKTSIAERLIRASNQYLWIPRTISINGEILRLYDAASHEAAPLSSPKEQLIDVQQYDRRWIRIRRPLVMVGGELRMEQLEVTYNPTTGILEAPVQLKSNGGALVVDDFGRQRCNTDELLNRWIVPLEKGYDFQRLPSGRLIQFPFDQLLVFSTNIEPHKLVDEAFLRRIPYKIEVTDPTPREFRELLKQWCGRLAVEYQEEAAEHLLARHFAAANRPMRFCHPRDLVLQVRAFCEFHEQPVVLTAKALDVAVKNYFAGL